MKQKKQISPTLEEKPRYTVSSLRFVGEAFSSGKLEVYTSGTGHVVIARGTTCIALTQSEAKHVLAGILRRIKGSQ